MGFERVAQQFLKCIGVGSTNEVSNAKHIFLASDSRAFKYVFVREAQKQRVPVFFSNVRAVHVGHTVVHAHQGGIAEQCDERTAIRLLHDRNWLMFINIFVEFFAIAKANLVVSNMSGFSRLAHMLSDAPTPVSYTHLTLPTIPLV